MWGNIASSFHGFYGGNVDVEPVSVTYCILSQMGVCSVVVVASSAFSALCLHWPHIGWCLDLFHLYPLPQREDKSLTTWSTLSSSIMALGFFFYNDCYYSYSHYYLNTNVKRGTLKISVSRRKKKGNRIELVRGKSTGYSVQVARRQSSQQTHQYLRYRRGISTALLFIW